MEKRFLPGSIHRYSDLMNELDGGSHQFYLPFRGQKVFAAFLNKLKNPEAPAVILVGSKGRVPRAGALLARQTTPIPVFVKQATNAWRYEGHFRSASVLDGPTTAAKAKAANRTDVVFAVRLEQTEPDEDVLSKTYEEGRCKQITRNKFERNEEARTKCLNYYGYACCVCDLLFETEYGPEAKDFIHVHHLNPLHLAGGSANTDPIKHLRPVCPNCHARLHAGKVLLTPSELRLVYQSPASLAARRARILEKNIRQSRI